MQTDNSMKTVVMQCLRTLHVMGLKSGSHGPGVHYVNMIRVLVYSNVLSTQWSYCLLTDRLSHAVSQPSLNRTIQNAQWSHQH